LATGRREEPLFVLREGGKAGITTICIHKGLLPVDYAESILGGRWKYANVHDVPKAAKDWPQLSVVMYHSALRPFAESPEAALALFENNGHIEGIRSCRDPGQSRGRQRLR
jgi:uncharacterized protein